MYPNITLQIKDLIPTLLYFPEEGMSRTLILKDENIRAIIESIAEKLSLLDEAEQSEGDAFSYLIKLCAEGDERLIEKVPPMDRYKNEFGIEDYLQKQLESFQNSKEDFSQYEDMTAEVLRELQRNQHIDILASLVETMYNIVIAKTLLFASDLGIGSIKLIDLDGLVRFQERMASELSKMEIEFEIESI